MTHSTEKIDGQTLTIFVDGSGLWTASFPDGAGVHGATRDVVIKKARLLRRRKAVKLSIPASLLRSWRVDHVTITGIHAKHHRVLFRHVKTNRPGELNSWSEESVARRLTTEEVQQYVQLSKAVTAAEGSLQAFKRRVLIDDVEKFVASEVEKAAEEPAKDA